MTKRLSCIQATPGTGFRSSGFLTPIRAGRHVLAKLRHRKFGSYSSAEAESAWSHNLRPASAAFILTPHGLRPIPPHAVQTCWRLRSVASASEAFQVFHF